MADREKTTTVAKAKVYLPCFVPGQFDDAPEDKDPIIDEGNINEYDEDESEKYNYCKGEEMEQEEIDEAGYDELSDDFIEDELNDNEEWAVAQGGSSFTTTILTPKTPSTNQKQLLPTSAKKSASVPSNLVQTNRKTMQANLRDQMNSLSKYAGRIHLDDLTGSQLSTSVTNDIRMSNMKAQGNKQKKTDKSDRATVEQVLDPRTRIILFKLINRNFIYEINGCISTGKEANVYHARTEAGEHRAIKVYKTSILTFKDRDRYVTGEYRFRHGYSKHNPRKMVKLWAEKEMRNLKRLCQAQVPCPEPLLLKMHVLVMGFLGDKNG
ncbi:2373_t:CDS:2, partial [Ambispora leptoticha]